MRMPAGYRAGGSLEIFTAGWRRSAQPRCASGYHVFGPGGTPCRACPTLSVSAGNQARQARQKRHIRGRSVIATMADNRRQQDQETDDGMAIGLLARLRRFHYDAPVVEHQHIDAGPRAAHAELRHPVIHRIWSRRCLTRRRNLRELPTKTSRRRSGASAP